ncbi:MAG: endonuclease domain-containing protein, partial [bacterium]
GPLGPFIADFYCHRAKLVIEVDGPIHSSASQREIDRNRDIAFVHAGITVLRYSNDQVLWNHRKVLKTIDTFLAHSLP